MSRSGGVLVILALLALSACNLAGDVTPPPGVSANVPDEAAAAPTPLEPVVAAPPERPDSAAGMAIYAERCAACHGQDGLGDGPQAADLSVAPAALADPELAGAASPGEWYQVVTEGRMARFMPPFRSLSDGERWDVVAYSLSLSFPPPEEGADLYASECEDCHGPNGEGAGGGPSLVSLDDFAARSRQEMAMVIREGAPPAMPAFGADLSEAEVEELAAHVQRLALGNGQPEEVGQQPEGSEETMPGERAVVVGQVTKGSTGDPVSGELEVTLHAFDGQQQVLTEVAEVDSQGEFMFSGLEVVAGRLFIVSTDYRGVRYTSEVGHLVEPTEPTELSITVHDPTSEPREVIARRIHILMDEPADGALRVVELWVLVNGGQRTVVPIGGEGGVEIALPEGATNLRFEDSLLAERYEPTAQGFRLNTPLRPASEGAQVVFSFDLPFQGGSTLVQPLTVPVEAATVLVTEGGPGIAGPDVEDAGSREAAGERFHQYDVGAMRAGETLRLTLEGPPLWQRLAPSSLDLRWAVGAGALILVLAGIAWWYRPWIGGEERADVEGEALLREERRRQSLLQAIADLDEAFEAGEVEEQVYRHRRRELKSELIALIKPDDG